MDKPYRDPRGVWREPPEETSGLYPGLVVHDSRVSGSITFGPSRLPVWAVIGDLVQGGWPAVEGDYEPSRYSWDREQLAAFLYHLLDLRGEFARLILVLADAERAEESRGPRGKPWWEVRTRREAVRRELRRCLATLDEIETASRS